MDIIDYLPQKMKAEAEAYMPCGLEEIRVRAGKQVQYMFAGGCRAGVYISHSDIEEMINYLSGYSFHAIAPQLAAGYFTVEGGHRVGIAGQMGCDGGKITAVSEIASLNIRIAHQIRDVAMPLMPYIRDENSIYNTLVISRPGEGKTTMVLQIIAKLTRGEPIFPVTDTTMKIKEKRSDEVDSENEDLDAEDNMQEQSSVSPVNVIYQTAEDGLGDTIKPRLLAAGADCSKVMVIDDSDQPLTMADVRLEEAIVQTKAKMVVLDPIQGFLGANVDMHRANEIRPLMKRIAVLAEKYHCAVILIGHMNKNSNGKSSYRGLGSIDFQAAARSVLIVGRVKEEPEVRVVCHTKSSLAPEGMSIAFRLDKNNGFEWIGEYDISADELLNGDGRGQKSRKAKEFLLEILANGGMTQKKIAEEAEARGIKSKTLWNAKRELEIDSVKRGKQWYWMLPE